MQRQLASDCRTGTRCR